MEPHTTRQDITDSLERPQRPNPMAGSMMQIQFSLKPHLARGFFLFIQRVGKKMNNFVSRLQALGERIPSQLEKNKHHNIGG